MVQSNFEAQENDRRNDPHLFFLSCFQFEIRANDVSLQPDVCTKFRKTPLQIIGKQNNNTKQQQQQNKYNKI